METVFNSVKKAYINYALNNEHRINEQIYTQIGDILYSNKDELDKILSLNKRKINSQDIINIYDRIKNEPFEYKDKINMNKLQDNFVHFTYLTSSGVVTYELDKTEKVFECMLNAIKNRVGLVISDIDYNEIDDKNYLLMLVKKALNMYDIDENLIQIVPYEEWDETLSDVIVYSYYKREVKKKIKTDNRYIFIEDEEFEKFARDEYSRLRDLNQNVKMIKNSTEFDDAIEEINKTLNLSAIIYTKNPQKAFKFITLIQSDNVFVNSTLEFESEVEESKNNMLINKHVMYELNSIV